MISKDLCVVHLSDLHFSGGMARPVFERLIADIREQIEDGTNVVFVITGDFVSKGEVAENSENVLKFFRGLVDVLAGKINILDVEIVPGNHDGRRAEQGNSYNGNSYLLSLSEYEKLASNIYNEFSRANAKIKPRPICGSTGIDFCGRRIIFTRLDTSSFEMPTRLRQQIEKDLGTEAGDVGIVYKQMTDALKASLERQCKDACQEYQNEVASRGHTFPDLTIIVAHHPISSLNSTGFDDTEDTLFKKGLEFGDVWMSGHTHTAQNYLLMSQSRG